MQIDVPPVTPADLALPPAPEGTAEAAARVQAARDVQSERGVLNARLGGEALDRTASPDADGRALMARASEAMGLTARAYHRVLKVARTIADLDGAVAVRRIHVAEALSARKSSQAGRQAVSSPSPVSTFP